MTRSAPAVSRRRSAVARWMASSVPSSVGIGCAARSRTTASTSTTSSASTNARMVARRLATSIFGEVAAAKTIERSQALDPDECARNALPDSRPFGEGIRLSQSHTEQHRCIDVRDHRELWRSSRSRSTMSSSSLSPFGTFTRLSGGVPGAGFRIRSAWRSRTGMMWAIGVS
jgi:hypothetical protein